MAAGPPSYPTRADVRVPRDRRGLSFAGFLGILFGLAALVLGLALAGVTALYVRERDRREAAEHEAMSRSTSTSEASKTDDGKPDLPTVTRHVPTHSLRILEGCTDSSLGAIRSTLEDAIDTGSPEYNDGHFVDCYRTYVGAALDLERRLPPTCAGPARALENGRHTAGHLEHASEQAWAMRDAFDGLLDVIARSRQGGGANL
jgi:hypothetical protein